MDAELTPRGHRRRAAVLQALALTAAIAVALLTRATDTWSPSTLIVIALFCIGSELLTITAPETGASLSGSSLGITLAAVLYGGAPAAAIAALTITVGWLRSREPARHFRANLVICSWYPLLTGLCFHAVDRSIGADPGHPVFYLLVFAAALLCLALNVAAVALGTHGRQGVRAVAETLVAMVRPVLAAELFSAILTVVAAFVTIRLHEIGLAMFGIFLAIFQYLIGELITSRQHSERLRRIATTDELTGLANRERFSHAVQERIAAATTVGGRFRVMLMDLDRFKEVNDTLGHVYGDRLLCELGPRLVEAVGEGGLVARLGGDEFGILPAEDGDAPAAVESLIARLLAAAGEPFAVEDLALEIGASIGVASYPDDGEDSGALLRCADIAMYAAKEAQTGSKLYAAEQNQHSMRRLSVLSDIRRALSGDEIVVHYQPIVDLDDRLVRGAEALVRWQHPEHGLIAPGAFVQTVEQSGLIGPLTRHVLENAISQCARWRQDGRDMSVAVNLSVRNLLDRDLPRAIARMLDTYHVPANALQVEITESMIMTDPERALATVGRLTELGVRLSVDDFGTGYSSLANLRRLPIDELKIDRSFVSPMLVDESDLIIVRSTINLGHDLGLRIIAEGVEDAATLERLAVLGCDLAQGYHLGRPVDESVFHRWLADTPRVGQNGTRGPKTTPPAPVPAGWTTTTSGLVVAAPER
jgi:diguanylate cyclase (GGDEF)-like protein